ncbi:hypothetical protein ACVC7V_07745 [Hydrogenophaga sp. A37]
MNTKTATLSRRMALSALVGASLLTALPAMAIGRLTDVRIVNRDSGEVLQMYRHRGDVWVAGEPGARYAVELQNESRGRLLNVVSVDGVNVISGDTASFNQAGYVLNPGQRYDVSGWRKSSREIAAFEFTSLPRSYAARTGRPDDVGVIGVAVFRERAPYRQPVPEIGPYGRSAPAPEAQGKSSMQSKSHRSDPGNADQELGTGHGDRERDRVGETEFERRNNRPDEVVRIRYDSRENLMAMGIIPTYQRPSRNREPSAFPAARPRYVPDPN